ncbi:olfactory receptor 2G3-like [Emydura macquarii macquarii]|uniref:olfactory receptor 2G3-like n=1 Tax=Emydura macquarii macquarii TaxID=1129001 RepID=UPI00352B24A5
MADPERGNQTSIMGFILLGFGNFHELQILLFLLFLVIYIVTMAGNTSIVVLVVADQHLHTPMYFFLGNLSCLETCYTSAILPQTLPSLLTGYKTISFLIKLSCSDTSQMVLVVFLMSCIFVLSPFLLTLTSYICIISAILRIPSSTRRQKAFSTCSSHLMVVTVFYGTLIVYILQDTAELRNLNKVFSIFYTVLTPMVNPLIYSLRNKEVKEALRKALSKTVTSMSICK